MKRLIQFTVLLSTVAALVGCTDPAVPTNAYPLAACVSDSQYGQGPTIEILVDESCKHCGRYIRGTIVHKRAVDAMQAVNARVCLVYLDDIDEFSEFAGADALPTTVVKWPSGRRSSWKGNVDIDQFLSLFEQARTAENMELARDAIKSIFDLFVPRR